MHEYEELVKKCGNTTLRRVFMSWKTRVSDLRDQARAYGVPPGNHVGKLRGNLAGLQAIRVNRRWRLIFRWGGSRGEADGVDLDDHSDR